MQKLNVKTTDISPTFAREHNDGPVPDILRLKSQYKKVHFGKYHLSISKPDNCVCISNEVVLIRNIIDCGTKSVAIIAYQRFHNQEAFFEYPLSSTDLNIHKVSSLDGEVRYASVQEVTGKYVLLPCSNEFVALPLIHTCA